MPKPEKKPQKKAMGVAAEYLPAGAWLVFGTCKKCNGTGKLKDGSACLRCRGTGTMIYKAPEEETRK